MNRQRPGRPLHPKIIARRETIRRIVNELGKVPKLHEMRTLLRQRGVRHHSLGTVHNDYTALGYNAY